MPTHQVEISEQLRDAIENLYRAFATYPLPNDTGACPCCHSEADEKLLHAKPLRQLGPEHLGKYATDALLVWGDTNTYRHFLPRVFELVAVLPEGGYGAMGLEPTFSRLRLGHWLTWPNSERAAMQAFLHALWAEVLSREPGDRTIAEIADWICGIAQAEPDLKEYLDYWISAEYESANVHLAQFVIYTDVLKPGGSSTQAFWSDARDQYQQLQRWIQTSEVKTKIRAAADRWPSDVMELASAVLP